ncbi:MAG TPA: SLC13 family permease [Burkholderiales bacterium]|jgi:Na+/H+ antiporter NhaD/arsenite permease-like protein|nr:SLC13 family permease [Burkholderiales bacterium]
MSDFQVYLTIGIFAAVILVIAFDLADMTLAALLGVGAMIVTGILGEKDFLEVPAIAGGAISLLFGGMVVAHVLDRSGVFEWIGAPFIQFTGGSGKRFLLLLVLTVAAVCAFLPNATTVILFAPLIIRAAKALGVSYVVPMILTAIVSNAAGLLTLVGDPATFIVGSAIGMTFTQYLRQVSFAGLLAVLVIVPLLPRLMPEVWNAHRALPAARSAPRIERPYLAALALSVLAFMVLMFLFGEALPVRIVPPSVAIVAAALALLVIHGARVEQVDDVLRAVDWKTLFFLGAILCLMQGFIKTGLLQGLSLKLHGWFGTDFTLVALAMLAGVGVLSSVLANIPVVAASIVMTKGYLVAAEAVPELALSGEFSDWPAAVLPVFIAMMFGGTLGGNATMIGASANIVSVGICARHGERVTFARFLRYGLPITLAQLAVAALYLLVRRWWLS